MQTTTIPLAAGRHAFGDDPDRYGLARPDYPEALYDQLAAICHLESSCILEVGPGTGIATRRLLQHNPRLLLAVESDNRLADHLVASLGASCEQLEVLRTPFEEAVLPAESFDLGVAATAFHWLEQGPALDKVVSLLRPGGWWAMWWNVFGDPDDPDDFQKATTGLFSSLPASRSWQPGGARPFSLDADARLAQMRTAGLIGTRSHLMRWTLSMDTAHVQSLAATFSQVSQAEPRQRQRFLDQLGELVDLQFGGRVERRFLTALYVGRKPE